VIGAEEEAVTLGAGGSSQHTRTGCESVQGIQCHGYIPSWGSREQDYLLSHLNKLMSIVKMNKTEESRKETLRDSSWIVLKLITFWGCMVGAGYALRILT
jgi:hypothetical protein